MAVTEKAMLKDRNNPAKSARRYLILFIAVFSALVPFASGPARGQFCSVADALDACAGRAIIEQYHITYEDKIMQHISSEFQTYRTWLTDIFFKEHVLPALMLMTEQLSAVAMHQVFIFGTFLDAKQQLETQRLFQELQAEAHKDYHPSEDFCYFGTNIRSLASSEQLSKFNAIALSQRQIARHMGNSSMGAAETKDADKQARWAQFIKTYCDPNDNNRTSKSGTGLVLACGGGATNKKRVNIDIDYTRALEEPRTLDVDYTDSASTPEEEDVMALGNNLYGHDVLTRNALRNHLKNKEYQHLYMTLRSVEAKRSVAENSFNAIVGLKVKGPKGMDGDPAQVPGTNRFLGALMKELGVPTNKEIYELIGLQPSYYAQLEILAKKMYQNPDFYTNLYDKPTNVERKGVAMKAIDLMLDRAIYESQLRQEMVMSVLLSSKLRGDFRDINKDLVSTAGD
ncbi:MAG: hypothetical protein IT558_01975 [Alphaproteobacteria bacterium]|nr:hypothetical protein [Alphaproteobacteria bacterium]